MEKNVSIACLFTSKGYGRKNLKRKNPGLSKKDDVVAATETALVDFLEQLGKGEGCSQAITSVEFNAGSFKVPWKETQALIEEVFKDYEGRWTVVSR